jgi:ribose transport system substrate-binding protein
MARPGRPERNTAARSFRQLRRFHHVINSDRVFGTHGTAVVIGINGILPVVKQIETGAILASVDFNMFKIGCTATRAAVRHLKHEPLPEKVMLPAEIIDKTNYKAWLVPVDQRRCPEWSDVVR